MSRKPARSLWLRCRLPYCCHGTRHSKLHLRNGLDGFLGHIMVEAGQQEPVCHIEHLLPAISFTSMELDSNTPRSSITWNSKSSGVRSSFTLSTNETDPADRFHPACSTQASCCFRPDAGSGSRCPNQPEPSIRLLP